MNSIKPFKPAKGLTPTLRNISMLSGDSPQVSEIFRDDELTYKQDSAITGEILLTLLEALRQFRVQSGGSISVSNNTTVIKNNICSIVNNFRSAAGGSGSVTLNLLLKNISEAFSEGTPSPQSTELLINQLSEQIKTLGVSTEKRKAAVSEIRNSTFSKGGLSEFVLKKNDETALKPAVINQNPRNEYYTSSSKTAADISYIKNKANLISDSLSFAAGNSVSAVFHAFFKSELQRFEFFDNTDIVQSNAEIFQILYSKNYRNIQHISSDNSFGNENYTINHGTVNAAQNVTVKGQSLSENYNEKTALNSIEFSSSFKQNIEKNIIGEVYNKLFPLTIHTSDIFIGFFESLRENNFSHTANLTDLIHNTSGYSAKLFNIENAVESAAHSHLNSAYSDDTLILQENTQEVFPLNNTIEKTNYSVINENTEKSVYSTTVKSDSRYIENTSNYFARLKYELFGGKKNSLDVTTLDIVKQKLISGGQTAVQLRNSLSEIFAFLTTSTAIETRSYGENTPAFLGEASARLIANNLYRQSAVQNEYDLSNAEAHYKAPQEVNAAPIKPFENFAEIYGTVNKSESTQNTVSVNSTELIYPTEHNSNSAVNLYRSISKTAVNGLFRSKTESLEKHSKDEFNFIANYSENQEKLVNSETGETPSVNTEITAAKLFQKLIRKTNTEAKSIFLSEEHNSTASPMESPSVSALTHINGESGNETPRISSVKQNSNYRFISAAKEVLAKTAQLITETVKYADMEDNGVKPAFSKQETKNSLLNNVFNDTAKTSVINEQSYFSGSEEKANIPAEKNYTALIYNENNSAFGIYKFSHGESKSISRETTSAQNSYSYEKSEISAFPKLTVFSDNKSTEINRTKSIRQDSRIYNTLGGAYTEEILRYLTLRENSQKLNYKTNEINSSKNTDNSVESKNSLILRRSITNVNSNKFIADSAASSVYSLISKNYKAISPIYYSDYFQQNSREEKEYFTGENSFVSADGDITVLQYNSASPDNVNAILQKPAFTSYNAVIYNSNADIYSTISALSEKTEKQGGKSFYDILNNDLTLKNSLARYNYSAFESTVLQSENSYNYTSANEAETASVGKKKAHYRKNDSTGKELVFAYPEQNPNENSAEGLPHNETEETARNPALPTAEELYSQLNINSNISKLLSSEKELNSYIRNQIISYFSQKNSNSGDKITLNNYNSIEIICEQVMSLLERRLKTERRLNGR